MKFGTFLTLLSVATLIVISVTIMIIFTIGLYLDCAKLNNHADFLLIFFVLLVEFTEEFT